MLVALSIKYTDSIMKTIATTGSIVLTTVLNAAFLSGPFTLPIWAGRSSSSSPSSTTMTRATRSADRARGRSHVWMYMVSLAGRRAQPQSGGARARGQWQCGAWIECLFVCRARLTRADALLILLPVSWMVCVVVSRPGRAWCDSRQLGERNHHNWKTIQALHSGLFIDTLSSKRLQLVDCAVDAPSRRPIGSENAADNSLVTNGERLPASHAAVPSLIAVRAGARQPEFGECAASKPGASRAFAAAADNQ